MNRIRKLSTLFLLLVFITIAVALQGCAHTPEDIKECRATYMNFKDIEACEQRVVRREDLRHKREMKKLEERLTAEKCWIEEGGIYDQETGLCRTDLI